jgi:hypothetical protein
LDAIERQQPNPDDMYDAHAVGDEFRAYTVMLLAAAPLFVDANTEETGFSRMAGRGQPDCQPAGNQSPCGSVVCPTSMM